MMKKIIVILMLCLAIAKLKAQTFTKYADTANYLIHQIENKKSLFLGKPLSVLLDSLKIQIVDAYTGASAKSDFGKRLLFEFNRERKFEKVHFITIEFDSVPSYEQLFPQLYPGAGQRATLQKVIEIYKTLIIKDVGVKDYTDDDPVNPDVHY